MNLLRKSDWPLIFTVSVVILILFIQILGAFRTSAAIPADTGRHPSVAPPQTSGVDEKLAGYTLWLAVGTGILAIAAAAQFELGRRTGMRQLRAYLFLNERSITVWKGVANCRMQVRNSGQTPASSVEDAMQIWLDTYPVPTLSPTIRFDPDKRVTYSMGPGDKFFLYGEAMVGSNDILLIQQGKMAVWAVGEIHYADAFRQKRTTRFRACAFGPDFIDDNQQRWMTVMNDGNDAD